MVVVHSNTSEIVERARRVRFEPVAGINPCTDVQKAIEFASSGLAVLLVGGLIGTVLIGQGIGNNPVFSANPLVSSVQFVDANFAPSANGILQSRSGGAGSFAPTFFPNASGTNTFVQAAPTDPVGSDDFYGNASFGAYNSGVGDVSTVGIVMGMSFDLNSSFIYNVTYGGATQLPIKLGFFDGDAANFQQTVQFNTKDSFIPSANATAAIVTYGGYGGGLALFDAPNYCAVWSQANGTEIHMAANGTSSGFPYSLSFRPSSGTATLSMTSSGQQMLVLVGSDSGVDFTNGTTIFRMGSDGRMQLNSQNSTYEFTGHSIVQGGSSPQQVDYTGNTRFQQLLIGATSNFDWAIGSFNYGVTSGSASGWYQGATRAARGSTSASQAGDNLFSITAMGDMGGNYFGDTTSGSVGLQAIVESNWSTNGSSIAHVPTFWQFVRTENDSLALIETVRIDSAGRVRIGGPDLDPSLTGGGSRLQLDGTSFDGASFQQTGWGGGGAYPSQIFRVSNNSTPGGQTAVTGFITEFDFYGSDGTAFRQGAEMDVIVDGAVSAGVVPMRFQWSTMSALGSFAERMRIDRDGRIYGLYGDMAHSGTTLVTPVFNAVGNGNSCAFMDESFSSSTGGVNGIISAYSRSNTPGVHTIVQSGDLVLDYSGWGSNGTQYKMAVDIMGFIDGTPGVGSMPGRLVLATTPVGSVTAVERFRIDSNGYGYFGRQGQIDPWGGFVYQFIIQSGGSVTSNAPLMMLQEENSANPVSVTAGKTRGGGFAILHNNDAIVGLRGAGGDGTNFVKSGALELQVDGNPAVGAMPSRWVFLTSLSGGILTEAMRIDSAQDVNIGNNGAQFANVWGDPIRLQVSATGGGNIDIRRYGGFEPYISSAISHGALGSTTAASNNDITFSIYVGAYDSGNVLRRSAQIQALVDAAPTASSVPGRWVFSTAPSGGLPTPRLIISADSRFTYGDNPTPNAANYFYVAVPSSSFGSACFFDKPIDATNASKWVFNNVGGRTSDAGGGAFWRGFHLWSPVITDPVGGANVFPITSLYWEYNSYTAPTTRNFVIEANNVSATSRPDIVFRIDTLDQFRISRVNSQATFASLDVLIATSGSTTTNPRLLSTGNGGFAAGEAARWQMGDAANAIQNAFGDKMQIYAYHGIEISGARGNTTPPAFVGGGGAGDPSVIIFGRTVLSAADGAVVTVGANGATNPVLQVDSSAANVVTGIKVTGAASGGGVFIAATSSNANETLNVAAKGSGELILNASATGQIKWGTITGYNPGTGGAVTQATSKSTAVTLNTVTGQITMNAAALAANTSVTFTVNNSTVGAKDTICLGMTSGSNNSYVVVVDGVGAGVFNIVLRNQSAGSRSDAVVINFAVIRGQNS